MEVSDEKFNELPQLDRIEYRQIRGIIARNGRTVCLFFLFVFLLVALTGTLADYEIIPMYVSHIILGLLVFLVILLLIWMYYITQNVEKLDEEYFKIEVRKK